MRGYVQGLAVLVLTMLAIPVRAAEIEFNIDAQPLASALSAFAQQADLQILYPQESVRGLYGKAVRGKLDKERALQLLLEKTGLQASFAPNGTVLVKVAAATAGVGAEPFHLSHAEPPAESSNAQPTRADEGSNSGSSNSRNTEGGIQEIVVTAQKQKARLQDVPMSVTAITSEQIKERGAVDIKDVLGTVPGLSYSNVERGQSRYAIRGISTTMERPTTGIYLDDISLISGSGLGAGAFDPVLFDIERVEVLKGPQGTLYGDSAMGGAIKYVSARPHLDAFSSEVAAGLSSIQDGEMSYNGEFVLNAPLVPGVLAVRAGAAYWYEGGYVDNVANLDVERTGFSSTPFPTYTPELIGSGSAVSKDDYNYSKTTVGRVSLLWQPNSSWAIRPAFQYQSSTSENPPSFLTNHSGLVSSSRFNSQPTDDRSRIFSLDVNKSWGLVEITSLTAYALRQGGWHRDYSYVIGSLINDLYPNDSLIIELHDRKTFSQEFRIASPADSQGRLRWVGGLYYSSQDDETYDFIHTFGAGIQDDLLFGTLGRLDLDQYAAFGELTYRVTNALDITLGARLFKMEQEISPLSLEGFFVGGQTIVIPGLQGEEDGITPKIGAAYRLDEQHMIYASAAQGFRPGQPLADANDILQAQGCGPELARLGITRVPTQLESDEVWTYELGSKNELSDGNVVINGAIYYTDWKDIQQGIGLPTCGAGFVANAGAAEVKGAELEARFAITPAFTAGVSGAYTDAKIVEAAYGTGTADGDEVLDTPEWTASAYGAYSLNLTDAWDLDIRLDYQYRGRQRRLFATTRVATYPGGETAEVPYAAVYQGSYDIANAALILNKGETNIRLFVNNIMNERPGLDTNLGTVSQSTTLRPRTVGLEVRQQF